MFRVIWEESMNALKIGLSTLVLVLVSIVANAQTMSSPELQTMIDDFVAERMEQGKLPGLSLVIVKDGQILYTKGYGFANIETQTPMTDRTPVAVASQAKGMTALAVMQLVEQGKVDLDAPVPTYLPWFKVDDLRGRSITVRQVLTHTAGLPTSLILDGNRDPNALEQRVHELATVKLNRDPGTAYEYATDGYAIAGLIVQTVSGMPYKDYMAQNIFAPLDMQEATFDPDEAEQNGLAQGYSKQRGVLSPAPMLVTLGFALGSWALVSARDLGNYFTMLLEGGQFDGKTIVAKSSIEEMWKPLVSMDAERSYGLGWNVLTINGVTTIANEAEELVNSSQFILIPEQNLGVGVTVNLSTGHSSEIARGVVTLMQGGTPEPSSLPVERDPSTFKADPALWANYVGDYDSGRGPVRIYIEGDKLLGQAGDLAFELEAYGENDFALRGAVGGLEGYPITFSTGEDNQLIILLGGQLFGQKK
jgi:CubicO group peptidase (beta-lactamase class C family)